MSTMYSMLDQGTTFMWTQAYDERCARSRVRDWMRHAAFAVAVLVFVGGAAGFVGHEGPALQYARSSESRPAL